MKILKIKRVAFALFTAIILLVAATLPSVAATSQIDYEAPIPLGAEVDLVVGLSEDDIKLATEKYNSIGETTYGKLENMRYNFMKSIDEGKYYAGAYWEGDPYLLDGEGNRLLAENGKPLKNLERDLHILVTDMSIVPKEINHPKLFFEEVKYSEAELLRFEEIIRNRFVYEDKVVHWGLAGMVLDTKGNRIDIFLVEGFDAEQIFELVPKDACCIEFVEDEVMCESLASPVYNGKLVEMYDSGGNFRGGGSIGFPVQWGTTGANKGWITAGHVGATNGLSAKYNGGSAVLGTTGNVKVAGDCDVQTILRTNANYCSHHEGPYGDTINYQESDTASLPVIDTWVEYLGQATGGSGVYTWIIGTDGNYTDKNGYYVYSLVVVDETTGAEGDSGGLSCVTMKMTHIQR